MQTTRTILVGTSLALVLSGCGFTGEVERTGDEPSTRPTTADGGSTTTPAEAPRTDTGAGTGTETGKQTDPAGGPHVAGYAYGEIPPLPLFTLPDLSMLDTSLAGFSIDIKKSVGTYPGLVVEPARCDKAGQVITGSSALTLYGDGSGNYTGPDGAVQNFGDGSGNYTIGGTTVQVFGDGSGNYTDGSTTVQSYGDGSGNYTDADTAIQIFGDGSGNYTGPDGAIQNFGDGSGNATFGETSIQNFGDGSANYTDGQITIANDGDGTGQVNGVPAELDPVETVPPLSQFPSMGTIRPITSCGTTITLRDSVLFDFDRSDLRPEATPVLDSLARALDELDVTAADIGGHTDSIGSDAYNDDLSARRADAVLAALTERDVTATLDAEGFGESRPVAPNTLSGKDNPAGRQLNRRVEIFIPTAGPR